MKTSQIILLTIVIFALFSISQASERKRHHKKHTLRRHKQQPFTLEDTSKYFFASMGDPRYTTYPVCPPLGNMEVTFDVDTTRRVCDEANTATNKFRFMAFKVGPKRLGGMQHPQDHTAKSFGAHEPDLAVRLGEHYTKDQFSSKYGLLRKTHDALFNQDLGAYKAIAYGEHDGYLHQSEECVENGPQGMSCSTKSLSESQFGQQTAPCPMEDFMAPKSMEAFIQSDAMNNPDTPVVAHCTGGTGRTGFVLASMMMKLYHDEDPTRFQELLNQPGQTEIFTVSRDSTPELKALSDSYTSWWMKATAIHGEQQYNVGFNPELTPEKIMEIDQLTMGDINLKGEQMYLTSTNQATINVLNALRCVYKPGAVETASQVRKLDEFARRLAFGQQHMEQQKYAPEQQHVQPMPVGPVAQPGQITQPIKKNRLAKKSKKSKKSKLSKRLRKNRRNNRRN